MRHAAHRSSWCVRSHKLCFYRGKFPRVIASYLQPPPGLRPGSVNARQGQRLACGSNSRRRRSTAGPSEPVLFPVGAVVGCLDWRELDSCSPVGRPGWSPAARQDRWWACSPSECRLLPGSRRCSACAAGPFPHGRACFSLYPRAGSSWSCTRVARKEEGRSGRERNKDSCPFPSRLRSSLKTGGTLVFTKSWTTGGQCADAFRNFGDHIARRRGSFQREQQGVRSMRKASRAYGASPTSKARGRHGGPS